MNENPKNEPGDDVADAAMDETAPVTGLPYESAAQPAPEPEPVEEAEPAAAARQAEPVQAPPAQAPTTVLEAEPTSWRHPVNVGHLVMGVAFAGLVLVWALITGDVIADDEIRWLMPVPWVVAGALGLIATTWSNLRARKARELRY